MWRWSPDVISNSFTIKNPQQSQRHAGAEDGTYMAPGIKIGGHSERLCVPTVFWSPDQYQDHWASSLSHLKKHGRSIFVVSIVAPICDDQLLHCWAVSSQPSICAQEWIIDTEDYTGELALNQLTEKFMPDDQSIDELFSHGSVFK